MSFEVQTYFGPADVYIRRIVLRPPETEFQVYRHSELTIAQSYNEPNIVTSVVVDGVHPAITKTSRIFRIPELGHTSTVRVSLTQECIGFIRVHIPAGQLFEDEEYHHGYMHNVTFYRSPDELTKHVESLRHIRIENHDWLQRVRDHLRDLTSIHVCFSHYKPVDWADVRDVVMKMNNLESLRVSHHMNNSFVFELYPNTPKKLQLDGVMELVGLEHLVNVTDLTLCPHNTAGVMVISHEIVRFLRNLERLSLSFMRLPFSLLELQNMSELELHDTDVTFEDCVSIGRLLRRNRLQKLSIVRCQAMRKHGWRPVLMPLVDGANTSLQELKLSENNLSKHVYYMLEDIVNFCPTLTCLEVPSRFSYFNTTVDTRQCYFNTLGNIKCAKKDHVREGSKLARALTITFDHFRLFQNVYRRKNRRWKVLGTREAVCAPLDFVQLEI
jgi:hypothetical protein